MRSILIRELEKLEPQILLLDWSICTSLREIPSNGIRNRARVIGPHVAAADNHTIRSWFPVRAT